MPKQYSYQGHPVICKVHILGQDISDSIKSIEGIESSLDYPRINEFRISEATFTLSDPENDFNPQKTDIDNFYKREGDMESPAIGSSGYRSRVRIEAGFIVNGTQHTEDIYHGQILNVHKDAKTGDVRITCSDTSQKIRDEDVTDFGIKKKMRVESSGGNLHGNYPFFIGLTEPSLESVEGVGTRSSLDRKQSLRTEGALDENNFRELPTGIETEGGPLTSENIGGQLVRDADLKFKSPYRSRTIGFVVKKLLDRFEISRSDINPPIATSSTFPTILNERFFSNLGRPGYQTSYPDQTGAIDFGYWQWPGTVTDMIANESGNELYLLISQTGSAITVPPTSNPKPRIIKWDLNTDERTLVTAVTDDTNPDLLEECWKFVANSDFSEFYVLGTRPVYINAARDRDSGRPTTRPGFEFGSYDSSEYNNTVNSKVLIHKMTRSGTAPNYMWARETYIDPDLVRFDLLPQLAMHYHLGFARTSSTSQNRFPNRQGNLPDSRRNLYLASNGNLYYAYAKREEFGVARATSANNVTIIIRANRDEDGFNLAGFDFWIEEGPSNYVYLAYTNIKRSPTESRFKIIRKDLPTL